MAPGVTTDQARQWLETQLAELGKLRNANTRDSGFKHWRQHTLTVIQRIWTDDTSKASRFKRIAFTPQGVKNDPRTVRTTYEHGCDEAQACLKALLKILSGAPDDILEGSTAAPEPEPQPIPVPPREAERVAPVARPPAPPRAREPEAPAPPPLPAVRRPATPPAAPAAPVASAPSKASTPPMPSAPPTEDPAVHQAMTDFMTRSPVFAAFDQVERDRGSVASLSPAAMALAALAGELADLGVPAPHRPRVRAALQELARHIGQHDLSWDELRSAVNVAMEFPGVGRRVVPLVVPFLDAAA